jgi:hypothetical protein
VYAAAVTVTGPPPATDRAVSTPATVPVVGSIRRFCPVSLTIRSRSTVGLKSTPNRVPASGVLNGSPTGAAAPVAGSSTYSRLVLPTPYSWPLAGRVSMPTSRSPAARPVMVTRDPGWIPPDRSSR